MATKPDSRPAQLRFDIANEPAESVVRCTGRITSDTTESLKSTVKPLLSRGKTVVLDLTNVDYMDSSGLGTIVGLYVSAKVANSQLKLVNLNKRLQELFSLTRLGEVMAEGRDPNDWGIP
jgi:anti-anti-sigma factor